MNKIWLISDQHFFHSNIIDICNRPFKDVDEMNEELIKNHNSCVKNGHVVIHLGDFCFGNTERISYILSRLNGEHKIVLGNHDHKSVGKYFEAGFKEVYKYPIIMDGFYILSHKPVFLNKTMPYVNVHGHLHDTNMELKLDNDLNLYYNICLLYTSPSPRD